MNSSVKVKFYNQEEILKQTSIVEKKFSFKSSEVHNKSLPTELFHQKLPVLKSKVTQPSIQSSETIKLPERGNLLETKRLHTLGDGLKKRNPQVSDLKICCSFLQIEKREEEFRTSNISDSRKEQDKTKIELPSEIKNSERSPLKSEKAVKKPHQSLSTNHKDQKIESKTLQNEQDAPKKINFYPFDEDLGEYQRWVLTQAELLRFKRAKKGR